MGAGSRWPVEAPPATPPRTGLLASALSPPRGEDPRWENGFSYAPENCAGAGILDPCEGGSKSIPDNREQVDWEPFTVWAGDKCNARGILARDLEARARRLLEAAQHKQIEAELWSGALAKAVPDPDYPNRYLAHPDSDVVTGTTEASAGVSPTNALACLEQGIANSGLGGQGFIHATRQLVSLWNATGALRREGNLIYTINDNVVVPGSGYDGSGPSGQAPANGAVWAYATGPVVVRLGTIEVFPSGADTEAQIKAALGYSSTNKVEIRAERPAAATFDTCVWLAAKVDINPCNQGSGL